MAEKKNIPGNRPGGNPGNKPGGGMKPKFNSYWIIGVILLVMIGIQLLSSNGGLQEIDSNRFFHILKNGDIEKLVIVNKEKVEVYIRAERLTDAVYEDVRSQKSNTVLGQSVPQYYYSIISQDVFVTELNEVMNTLPQDNRPSYTTVTRRNYLGEIMLWVLPFLLILGIWIYMLRRMGGGGGGGGSNIFSVGKSKAQIFDKDTNVKTASQCGAHLIQHLFRSRDLPLFRKIPGCSKGPAPGYDRNLYQWIGIFEQPAYSGVPCLVPCNGSLLHILDNLILLFQSANNAVNGIQEILAFHYLFIFPGSDQCRFIAYIGDICS